MQSSKFDSFGGSSGDACVQMVRSEEEVCVKYQATLPYLKLVSETAQCADCLLMQCSEQDGTASHTAKRSPEFRSRFSGRIMPGSTNFSCTL
jgi:hypothetical protein